jgi:hypothetical protein
MKISSKNNITSDKMYKFVKIKYMEIDPILGSKDLAHLYSYFT